MLLRYLSVVQRHDDEHPGQKRTQNENRGWPKTTGPKSGAGLRSVEHRTSTLAVAQKSDTQKEKNYQIDKKKKGLRIVKRAPFCAIKTHQNHVEVQDESQELPGRVGHILLRVTFDITHNRQKKP